MARQRFSANLPSISTGLRAAWREGYSLSNLHQDVMAGLTVGTVAVPLSMALAIATGSPLSKVSTRQLWQEPLSR